MRRGPLDMPWRGGQKNVAWGSTMRRASLIWVAGSALEYRINTPAFAPLSQRLHPSNLHPLITHLTTTAHIDIARRWSYTSYVCPLTPHAVPSLILPSCSPQVCGNSAVQRTSEHRHYFSATDVPDLSQGRVKQRARGSRARQGQTRSRTGDAVAWCMPLREQIHRSRVRDAPGDIENCRRMPVRIATGKRSAQLRINVSDAF